MAAYLIVAVEVSDAEAYRAYSAEVPATLEPFGGRFVVRGGAFEVIEGSWDAGRIVVIEFPSADEAKAWHASEAYQAILPIREANARTDFMLVVDGVDAEA